MDTNQINHEQFVQQADLLEMAPEYSLYSLNQLVLATIIGGPFAGFFMIYYNLKKLGLQNLIWRAAIIIFGVLFLSFLPDLFGYDGMPGLVYNIAFTIATYFAGKYLMEQPLSRHFQKGGTVKSGGMVTAVILLSFLFMVVLIFSWFILYDFEGFKAYLNE